jgi:hypothetical protein
MSQSDSPQPVASEAEIDALEYVVHQGIIGAYDRPVLLAWLARLQRTPAEPSTPGEGTRQAEGIVTRLRQTRADMIGTDDEDHYFDCHEAAAEIERLRLTGADEMRIDPDTCREPDLLAAEVRRLQAVIDAGEPTLTDAEREAIEVCIQDIRFEDVQATLRGLLERTK